MCAQIFITLFVNALNLMCKFISCRNLHGVKICTESRVNQMQSLPWQHVDVAILECAELKNECVLQWASRVTEVCNFQA
jgi:hypothetical protein